MIFTTPIHVSARRLAIAAFALSMATPVVAAGTLSLEQAEKRALERDNVARLLDSRRQQAEGELTTAGLWPNPTIDLSQESTDLAETTSRERFFWLYQEFDISGERGLRREAARARLAATGFAAGATRLDIRTRVRRLFFDSLYRQRQVEAITARRERLAELVDRVRRQEQAGQAAQYDVVRLERAADALGARAAGLKAEYERALARLFALLGEPGDNASRPQPAGKLVPAPPPPLDRLLRDIDALPRLQQLQAQARASRLTAKAEGRAAIPDITLGVGYKEQEEFGRSFDGTLISLGVSIPLFDRNQGKRASARAAARASEAEYRLALAELRGDIRGRWLQLRALLENVEDYRQSNAASTRKLLRAAESGYRGAEVGVLEVVDAYESALEATLRVLELQKQARDAHIDLQALTHGVPQP
ncbi:TolC family protein [Salinisphaera sp. P385]|uniref:TolC family protein n=1 Tax=Spectribacter acetivorans TaxID=3075603 RepID=A0ABU3B4U0_9GAMM|nr:TolC family protein [Salinisphaera sp. P385]MDT0617471.1 TolC family protein [Salinisphaera sp. P385]